MLLGYEAWITKEENLYEDESKKRKQKICVEKLEGNV